MTEPPRRRRRIRTDGTHESVASSPAPSPADPAATTSPIHDADAQHDEREVERGLRGLVGGGSSQVAVAAAMRARDAARPTDEDLASAEANLIIIRRGWTPPPAGTGRQPPTG